LQSDSQQTGIYPKGESQAHETMSEPIELDTSKRTSVLNPLRKKAQYKALSPERNDGVFIGETRCQLLRFRHTGLVSLMLPFVIWTEPKGENRPRRCFHLPFHPSFHPASTAKCHHKHQAVSPRQCSVRRRTGGRERGGGDPPFWRQMPSQPFGFRALHFCLRESPPPLPVLA